MLRIGIVGYGAVSEEHIEGWKSSGNIVCAVADPKLRTVPPLSPTIRIFSSAEEMVCATHLDVLDVCTPHHLHWPQVTSTKGWEGPILVEKPLVMTNESLREMLPFLNRRAAPVIIRTNKRFEPHLKPLQAVLANVSSQSVSVKVVWRQKPEYMAKRRWYYEKAISGGGVVLGMGIHYLDIFAEYLPDLTLQHADLRTSRRRPNSPKTTVENYAHLKLSSAQANIELVLSCWRTLPVLPFEQITATIGENTTRWIRPAQFDRQRALADEFNSYASMIRSGRSHPSPAVLFRSHALALNAYSNLVGKASVVSSGGGLHEEA
jgi:predicted dehydrogenase